MHAKIKVQAPNTMGTIWIVKATQNTSVAPYQVKKVYTKMILYLMWIFIGNHGENIFFCGCHTIGSDKRKDPDVQDPYRAGLKN